MWVWVMCDDISIRYQKRAARRRACGTRGPILALRSPHRCGVATFGHWVSLRVARNPVALRSSERQHSICSNVDLVARTWFTWTTRASTLWISPKLMQLFSFLNLSLLQFNCCPPSPWTEQLSTGGDPAVRLSDCSLYDSMPTQVEHWIALRCFESIDWQTLGPSRTCRNIFDRCRHCSMILQLHTVPVSHWIWNGQEVTEGVDVAISYFVQEHQSIWKSSICND